MSDSKSTARRSGGAKSSKKKSVSAKSSKANSDGHVCREPGCEKVCRSAAGLASHVRQAHPQDPDPVPVESPADAVERVLATLKLDARQAVLVATVRELAKTLEECEPTDKTKTAKELTASMNELLSVDSTPAAPSWEDGE